MPHSDAARLLISKLDRSILIDLPDTAMFVRSLKIEDKRTGTLIPFHLWPCQLDALDKMDRIERLFLLKARQLGFTWLDLAFWLHKLNYWGNRLVLIARQNYAEAQDAIHRIQVLHASIPAELGPQRIVKQSQSAIWFENDSRIEALPATQRIARGRAAFGALADEFAFWDWQDAQLVSLNEACQRLHIVTTGNGPGDLASKIWGDATAGRGLWTGAFYDWTSQPDRLQIMDWYKLNVEEAPEPRLAKREYPSTPEEAFTAPEGVFFERFTRERNVDSVDWAPGWPTFRCVDFGYHSPACAWIQVSPSGQPFVVEEFLPHDITTSEFAEGILRTEAGRVPRDLTTPTYCDPAGRAINVATAESEVEVFRRMGLNPQSRASAIRDGVVRILNALTDPVLPLVIADRCVLTIEALATIRPDHRRPDLYDETSGHTHVLDALRYFFVNWRGHHSPYVAPKPDSPAMAGLYGRTW